jgi:hypothetical protein
MNDQRTAQIIPFPLLGLSEIAVAILRDMRRRQLGSDGLVCHSVADGMKCSAAARHKVVFARRELLDKGLVTLIRGGDGNGASVWQVRQPKQSASFP